MLSEIYIEALLVDEELADQVWKNWDAGETDDLTALRLWWIVATQSGLHRNYEYHHQYWPVPRLCGRDISTGLRDQDHRGYHASGSRSRCFAVVVEARLWPHCCRISGAIRRQSGGSQLTEIQ